MNCNRPKQSAGKLNQFLALILVLFALLVASGCDTAEVNPANSNDWRQAEDNNRDNNTATLADFEPTENPGYFWEKDPDPRDTYDDDEKPESRYDTTFIYGFPQTPPPTEVSVSGAE